MNEQSFVSKREADWIRLNQLADKADSSPAALSGAEIKEVFRLYRRVSTDLATVRTRSTNVQLVQFLNDLTVKSYAVLYRSKRRPFWEGLSGAVMLAAQTVRRRKAQVLLSAGIFVGAAVFAFITLHASPATKPFFIPAGWQETFDTWRDGEMQARTFDDSVAMTGFYASNNPRASVITGSIAASTFGVGTAKLLYENGAMLGALAFELEPVGRLGYLFIRILPHGVPELSGIVIAGAAGFVMAWALIHPGRKTRGQSLTDAGKDSLVLLLTGIVLMYIAAPIEGFFSFNPSVPDWAKLLVIAISIGAWGAFWVGYGRYSDDPSGAAETLSPGSVGSR